MHTEDQCQLSLIYAESGKVLKTMHREKRQTDIQEIKIYFPPVLTQGTNELPHLDISTCIQRFK